MNVNNKPQEVWVIIDKETEEIWKARSGKSSWKKKGHAKNAWANTYCSGFKPEEPYFDDQDEYILKQLADMTDWKKKYENLLEEIQELLKYGAVATCDEDFEYARNLSSVFDQGYEACKDDIRRVIKDG